MEANALAVTKIPNATNPTAISFFIN